MAYDKRNARMYVDCLSYTSLAVIDTITNTVETLVTVGSSPEGIVFNPRNGYIYAANDHNGNVSVVDPATNTAITSIELPPIWSGGSIELGYNPRNNYLYATVSDADAMVVMDATTNQVVTTFAVGDYPLGVAFNPHDGNMYAANYGDGTLSVVDSKTSSVVATIPVGQGPQWLAVNPRNGNLYVTNSTDGTVSVISIGKRQG
jgi:YVTN family beta-propeller protein